MKITDAITRRARLLRTLGHPVRLCMVKGLLERGEGNVSHIHGCLELPQSTVSQHLGKLRDLGIVADHRRGSEVFYRVVSEEARRLIEALFGGGEGG